MCAQAVFGGPFCNVISERLARALLPEKLIPYVHSHTRHPLPSLFYSIHIAFCTRTPSKPNWPLFVFAQAHPAPPPVVLYTYVLAFVSCHQVFSSKFSPYGILSILLPCFCFSVPLPPCVTQIKSQQMRFGGVAVLGKGAEVRK